MNASPWASGEGAAARIEADRDQAIKDLTDSLANTLSNHFHNHPFHVGAVNTNDIVNVGFNALLRMLERVLRGAVQIVDDEHYEEAKQALLAPLDEFKNHLNKVMDEDFAERPKPEDWRQVLRELADSLLSKEEQDEQHDNAGPADDSSTDPGPSNGGKAGGAADEV